MPPVAALKQCGAVVEDAEARKVLADIEDVHTRGQLLWVARQDVIPKHYKQDGGV